MKFSFELEIKGKKEKIWEYYSNLEKWYKWEEDLENITIDGDFSTGTKGKMKLKEMPEMDFILSSVIINKEFIDITTTPMGNISFGHFIYEKNNKVYINHEVELDNDDKNNLEILKNIFSDVPESMFLIKKLVEENEI